MESSSNRLQELEKYVWISQILAPQIEPAGTLFQIQDLPFNGKSAEREIRGNNFILASWFQIVVKWHIVENNPGMTE